MPIRQIIGAGDCVSSVAFEQGLFPDTIWNDPANAELKQLRKNPNTLAEGDILVIPDKRLATMSKGDQQRHRFRRKGVPEVLRLQFLIAGQPRANEPYTLEVDGRIICSDKKTDGEGRIRHAIAPDASRARVGFRDGLETFDFQLGRIESIDSRAGLKGRLKSLGFFEGPINNEATAALTVALTRFQVSSGLAATGEPDASTKDQLTKAYGG